MEKENENTNKKLKIYIADTDEKKALINYFATSEKFNLVGSSTNGHVVIEECKNLKPDFLISEVLLSECDGFLVLESLKQSMQDMCPKIIFISNLSHSGFVSKAIKEGASYFMVKPVSPQNLEMRIDELTKQSLGQEEKDEHKNYDPVKLDVVLPVTNEIEQIEYIPPKLGDESKGISKSINPQFKEFKPHFDVFELVSPICIPSVPDK